MGANAILGHRPDSRTELARLTRELLDTLGAHLAEAPYSGLTAARLHELLRCDLGARDGAAPSEVLARLATVIAHSIRLDHAHTVAHLHCPPLTVSVATELIVAALNPSMDSFDQAPAATVIELQVLRHVCDMIGFGAASGGTFTPGATQSNFLGLLLAREAFYRRRWSRSAWQLGMGEEAGSLRILCSEASHFSVEKSAAQLGLGTRAVIRVACDPQFRLSPAALDEALDHLRRDGLHAMAVVATAGTTDFGTIDPLTETAQLARNAGAWFHLDAAYGGALVYSGRHRGKLAGIDGADSVSIDFHKLLWQPIGCGAFLLRDAAHFDLMKMNADYLNPEENEAAGVPDLVTRSLLTTRRFDALKLWISLQWLGSARLEAMIDKTLALAEATAERIAQHPRLHLLHRPMLGCVVFRYAPARQSADADRINADIRRELFDTGEAVLGQTRVHGRTSLKITCMNPGTSPEELAELLERVVARGIALEDRG